MADFSNPGVIYEEKQTFRQKWLYWIIGGTLAVSIIPMLLSLRGSDLLAVIPFIFFSILAILMLRHTGLRTEVREDGFYYRFFPLHFKTYSIPWEDVVDYEILKYNPIADYGGWGIRYGFLKQGRAYNVSGNKGMKLYLKNGKHILFGTQNPVDLQEAMLHIFKPDDSDDPNDEQAFDLKDHEEVEKEKINLKDDGHPGQR